MTWTGDGNSAKWPWRTSGCPLRSDATQRSRRPADRRGMSSARARDHESQAVMRAPPRRRRPLSISSFNHHRLMTRRVGCQSILRLAAGPACEVGPAVCFFSSFAHRALMGSWVSWLPYRSPTGGRSGAGEASGRPFCSRPLLVCPAASGAARPGRRVFVGNIWRPVSCAPAPFLFLHVSALRLSMKLSPFLQAGRG